MPLPMRARSALLLTTAIAAAAAWGCGTSEESGDVGDNLSAKGLEVTVEVPRGSEPESLTYEFQDTGTAMDESENVDARLLWSVAGG